MNPTAIAATLAELALKHPAVASLIGDLATTAYEALLEGKSPWRRVIRKFLRVAGENAAEELANALIGLTPVVGTPSKQQAQNR